MSPQRFAAQLQTRSQAFERAVMQAEAQSLKDATKEAKRLSRGKYSLPGLARAGHPFSARRPNASFNPALIHQGGGRGQYERSWGTVGPKKRGGDVVSVLRNTDPNSRFLHGTGRMVDRWGPQRKAIVAKVQPRRLKRLRAIRF